VANFYLDRVHRQPFDPQPTLGERWRAGRGGTDGQWDARDRRLVPITALRSASGGGRDADTPREKQGRRRS
jgi:hypothetical protein